jgi:hypothetical protein
LHWNNLPKYDKEDALQDLSAYIQLLDFARYNLKVILREAALQDKIRQREMGGLWKRK